MSKLIYRNDNTDTLIHVLFLNQNKPIKLLTTLLSISSPPAHNSQNETKSIYKKKKIQTSLFPLELKNDTSTRMTTHIHTMSFQLTNIIKISRIYKMKSRNCGLQNFRKFLRYFPFPHPWQCQPLGGSGLGERSAPVVSTGGWCDAWWGFVTSQADAEQNIARRHRQSDI